MALALSVRRMVRMMRSDATALLSPGCGRYGGASDSPKNRPSMSATLIPGVRTANTRMYDAFR